jgi:hypothetical protein
MAWLFAVYGGSHGREHHALKLVRCDTDPGTSAPRTVRCYGMLLFPVSLLYKDLLTGLPYKIALA